MFVIFVHLSSVIYFHFPDVRPNTPEFDELAQQKGGSQLRFTIDDFDLLKVLGKGSFGKVNCIAYSPIFKVNF